MSLLTSTFLPNRGRRSFACVCDSEEEVQATGAWEEPGLGDVRSGIWAACVWRGIQLTEGAFGSSLQKKNQRVGFPGRLLDGYFWSELAAPG